MCRTVEDCAIVFNAIYGPDGVDQTVVDLPFNYNPKVKLSQLRIGYLQKDFEQDSTRRATNEATLARLRELGAQLIPLALPELPVEAMTVILSVEAAAAFDELTRSNRDSLLTAQRKNAWPNSFRSSRFIPAVEYINANRIRQQLIEKYHALTKEFDVIISPSFGGNQLLTTNLTGHPCLVMPNGFNSQKSPTSISFLGRLFGEADLIALGRAYQEATDWDEKKPDLFK